MDLSKCKPICLLVLGLLLFAGCRVELYSNLNEKEANAMMAILLKEHIPCEKTAGKENTFQLTVDENKIARAIDLLKTHGYPKDQFASVGEIFQKKGLVSSPLEERVRYIYALSQDLSETISMIDGVLSAKVHIVIPENDPLSDTIIPSSASVFIKHRMDADIQTDISKIKMMVVNSIQGLKYDKVSVFLFESSAFIQASEPETLKNIAGIRIATESLARLYMIAGIGLVLVCSLLTALIFMAARSRKGTGGTPDA